MASYNNNLLEDRNKKFYTYSACVNMYFFCGNKLISTMFGKIFSAKTFLIVHSDQETLFEKENENEGSPSITLIFLIYKYYIH